MKIHEISIKMSLKFIPNGPINNIQALSEPIVAKVSDVYMRHSASMS